MNRVSHLKTRIRFPATPMGHESIKIYHPSVSRHPRHRNSEFLLDETRQPKALLESLRSSIVLSIVSLTCVDCGSLNHERIESWVNQSEAGSFPRLEQSLSRESMVKRKVPPRFELGSLDSESRVLTITPWNLVRSRQDSNLCGETPTDF